MNNRLRKSLMRLGTFTFLALLLTSCAQSVNAPMPTVNPPAATAGPSVVATAPGQPTRGGTLAIGARSDPATYDLHTELSITVLHPIRPAYNGLIEYDPLDVEKIIPALATDWNVSPSGDAYTFHIRDGVKWQDGKPFTVDDVAFSLDKLIQKSPNLSEPLKSMVRKVEAVDEKTVRVSLDGARPQLLKFLADAWAVIMPKHVIQSAGDMKTQVVGTGAFKLAKHVRGSSLRLTRNEDYFRKGTPLLDAVEYFIIPDPATALATFRTGRVHMIRAFSLDLPQAKVLKDMPQAKVQLVEQAGSWNFWMPVNKAPWNDVRVRKAAWLAIDRQDSINIISEGFAQIGSFVPPALGGPTKDELANKPGYRLPKDADRAEAKKLLADAGFPQGIDTTLTTRTGRDYERVVTFMADQLATVGIRAKIRMLPFQDFFEQAYRRNYDTLAMPAVWKVWDPDALLTVTYYGKGNQRNYADLDDATVNGLIDDQSKTLDQEKRKSLVRQVDDLLAEKIPAVPAHWFGYPEAWWNDKIAGFRVPATITSAINYETVWLPK